MHPFFLHLQRFTESALTRRRALQRIKKEKLRTKNPVVDWIEAFVWAAGVVLLINQFLFQAYQLPTGSMINTLLEKDRIFVNKLVYGPELLPGIGKLSSPIKPQREDVIIFESPDYFSNGPIFDIAQRIIYMLTLSLVDIDRDDAGNPKIHFLIKRAAGMGGDQLQSRRGELFFRFAGEDRWVNERDYLAKRGFNHTISRLVPQELYPALDAIGRNEAYRHLEINPPAEFVEMAGTYRIPYVDFIAKDKSWYEVIRGAYPYNSRYRERAFRLGNWFVPEGRILPLGDNRDNSHDGRFFGTVRASKILGQGAFKYWPLSRLGGIK